MPPLPSNHGSPHFMLRTLCIILLLTPAGCGSSGPPPTPAPPAVVPAWVTLPELSAERVCGLGVAGASRRIDSPYPRRLARKRALRNLAGTLHTLVHEAIVDRQTQRGTHVEWARALTLNEQLLTQVDARATTEYWRDTHGEGPFARKHFTYAQSCLAADAAAELFALDASRLAMLQNDPVAPEVVPRWIDRAGRQNDGRLCAIGFTLPMFHPDKTFEAVAQDIRGQLAKVLRTFVSSYYEEQTTERYQRIESMTLATTEAVAEGTVVTHYWYDRDGIGPRKHKRTTYGWGCVYPIETLARSFAEVEPAEIPGQTVQDVRARAAEAFEALESAEEQAARTSAPVPSASPSSPETPLPDGANRPATAPE